MGLLSRMSEATGFKLLVGIIIGVPVIVVIAIIALLM